MHGSIVAGVIRGITAPASLKPLIAHDLPALARRYPGHNCPGLIEAPWRESISEYFGSGYPGHNCPGLIEAFARYLTKSAG
ncbi:protein of unknown function (plasmid) [Candidatus Methylocalor cossyra]|uniref:Uncharacterized protein n=1 Tax=Candidatus Methylocalor cossyra TaxID=3108543 RepID=A0ABM9NMX3_9GAMM